MIDGEIKCIYTHNGVNVCLGVTEDCEEPGNEIYSLAEMFIKVISDHNYNPDIIIDQMKSHFDYKREEDSEND